MRPLVQKLHGPCICNGTARDNPADHSGVQPLLCRLTVADGKCPSGTAKALMRSIINLGPLRARELF